MALLPSKTRLPARTLVLLVVGLLIALAFGLVFLVPGYQDVRRLKQDIDVARTNLVARQHMEPLVAALRRAETGLPDMGEAVGGGHLPLSELGKLTDIFDGMTTSSTLRVTSVTPEASSVTQDGLLAVRVGLAGEADAFREFLLALGRYAPLVKIESASTVVGRDGREYTVKCWLAVQ